MTNAALKVGTLGSAAMLSGPAIERQRLIAKAVDGGLDHLFTADHISFHDGSGMDGLITAALLAAAAPALEVCVGVYLLALRHPVPVARQIATLAESAPGRLVLGVGIGGEDRHELTICGVNPARRGRRTDSALSALDGLLSGQPTSVHDEFFAFDAAVIRPPPDPAVPVLIGGRSNAALVRAARYGDGWLAAWCSPRRFAEATSLVTEHAERIGRAPAVWQHGLQLWVGVDTDRTRARDRLAHAMQRFYRIPFEQFERYAPYGTPEDIAEALLPYIEAGCTRFNLMPIAADAATGIDAMAEVARRLRATS